jgi:hypothetical protein
MKFKIYFLTPLIMLIVSSLVQCTSGPGVYFNDKDKNLLKLGNRSYEIGLNKSNGGLAYITDKATGQPVTASSPTGCLWAAWFSVTPNPVDACAFSPGRANQFSYTWSSASQQLTLVYTPDPAAKKRMTATVTIIPSPGKWFDLQIILQNNWGYDLDVLAFPAGLVLYTDDTTEALLPILPGIVLEPDFFSQTHKYETTYPGYPGVFADFMAMSSKRGTLAVYSIGEEERLIPVTLGFDSTNCMGSGSTCFTHTFKGTAKNGSTWTSPRVRVRVSETRIETINAFRTDDGLAAADLLQTKLGLLYDRLVRSPLYKADATQLNLPFKDYPGLLDKIPEPGLLHPVGYGLKGFDRSYPDFIPPDPRWGSTQDMAAMFTAAQSKGFLVMPYTNPTWWDGESPTLQHLPSNVKINDVVALNELGSQIQECYGCPANPHYGFVVSPYASFVQQRLSQLQQQITQEIPSDLVFEDQIGARATVFDSNLASPLPESYIQGWVDHTRTYASAKLMTELGFDRLVKTETGFNGSILLPERAGQTDLWWGKDTWHVYPFAPMAARDKMLFYQHDLAPETFTHNKATLSWNASMGYMLSYDLVASDFGGGVESEFIQVTAAFQKYVLSRYASERITNYSEPQKYITLTSFETVTVTANWDTTSLYNTAEFAISPLGILIQKNDGSLTAGVFAVYNKLPLSGGDHFLIEERSQAEIILRQPLGADTMITVKPLPAWRDLKPAPGASKLVALTANAYSRDGQLIGSAPAVTLTEDGLSFLYTQVMNGQPVTYFKIFQ